MAKQHHLLPSIKNTLPRPLTPPPYPLPIHIENIRHGYQQRRKTPSDTARRPNPNIMIHRRHNQRKRPRKTTPQKRIRRHSRRSVLGESINKIVQRCLEDCEKACAQHDKPDDGCNPVELWVCRPAHHELPGCEKDGT